MDELFYSAFVLYNCSAAVFLAATPDKKPKALNNFDSHVLVTKLFKIGYLRFKIEIWRFEIEI